MFYFDPNTFNLEINNNNLDINKKNIPLLNHIDDNEKKIKYLRKCEKCILPETYPLIKFNFARSLSADIRFFSLNSFLKVQSLISSRVSYML